MRVITFKDIDSLNIAPSVCYDWAEDMIRHKGDSILPPKISLKPYDGVFCNVMPTIIKSPDGDYGGIKVVTRYPDRVPSLESRILLLDASTGEFLALMDGTWITAMRTGAVAAHTIRLLAKKDYRTMGFMGLGNVARSTLEILLSKEPDREFVIKLLRYKDQAEDFAARFAGYANLSFEFCDTADEMAKGSDVIVSGATYLPDDVCADGSFDEGVLVVPLHTLGFTNCDLFFDKVFADDTGHVHHFKNFDKFRKFAEVSDILSGKAEGRTDDKERILAYNIGIAVHDMYYASHIYRMMEQRGAIGALPEIDMQDPEEKFWV